MDGIPNAGIMEDSSNLLTHNSESVLWNGCEWAKSPLYPHHVHDGEDVGLHVITAMVFDELGVGHHHGLHPPLFADWALRARPSLASAPLRLPLPLPLLPLPLRLYGITWSIYRTDYWRDHRGLVLAWHLKVLISARLAKHLQRQTHSCTHTLNSTRAGSGSRHNVPLFPVSFWGSGIDDMWLWSLWDILGGILDGFNKILSLWQREEASLRETKMRD